MSSQTIFYGDLILPGRILEEGALVVQGGTIREVGPRHRISAAGAHVIEHAGYIAPGYVDIHVHGGQGADFMDGTAAAFQRIRAAHARHGTTSLTATTTVAEHELLLEVLSQCRAQMSQTVGGARVLGLHLYGPYFATEAVGCHPCLGLTTPDPKQYYDYFDIPETLVSATVAPELEGAEAFARACHQRGIVVNAGHSHCTFAQIEAGLDWGIRHVDHLFCAMSDRARLRSSQPFPMRGGLMEATLYFDQLTTEVIADGKHLARELLLLAYKIKGPQRLALITDASRAFSMPDGDYIFGPMSAGMPFRKVDGAGVTPDGTNVASSVMGMDHMVRTFQRLTGCPVPDAIRMATLTPAQIIHRDHLVGSFEPGKLADLLLLDRDLVVRQVWIGGAPVGSDDLFDV